MCGSRGEGILDTYRAVVGGPAKGDRDGDSCGVAAGFGDE